MIVLGLTGSIGMGKTTASKALRRMGIPVHDADAAVHRALAPGGAAVSAIEREFPGVVRNGRIDRQALGRRVFGDPAALARLEAIVHPLVRVSAEAFLRHCALRRESLVVLDVPLLFETGRDADVDMTILVSAPAFIQAQRVLRRPGMTADKLRDIRARQMPDRDKRRLADFIVPTGLGRRDSLRSLARIVRLVRAGKMRGRRLPGRQPGTTDHPHHA